jgi:hypothetical protein
MKMLIRISRRGTIGPLCALLAVLGGCASAPQIDGGQRAGYQPDGKYVLSAQEQNLGCRQLQERSIGLREQMQSLSTRAVEEMQQLPSTVAAAWGRLVGSPGDGVPAVAEYNEARAETAAVEASLAQKGCAPIDTASLRR